MRLGAYQDRLGIDENEPVMMVLDYQHVLNGFDAIRDGLFGEMDRAVEQRLGTRWLPPSPIEVPKNRDAGLQAARTRVGAFTVTAVLLTGLADGINPCAIATLVFFMSVLTLAVKGEGAGERIRGGSLLLVGVVFCLASFVTYTVIGLGLLRVLHIATGFEALRSGIEILLAGTLCVLSILSFRDAWCFAETGEPGSVMLQLPEGIKRKIYRVVREGLKSRNLLFGSLTIGTLVTALESVCTGQVYVPTLALVAKSGVGERRAWSLLLIYNAMFVTPLIVVLILTWCGLRTHALVDWSKKNVVLSKLLLGLVFAAMAVLAAVL